MEPGWTGPAFAPRRLLAIAPLAAAALAADTRRCAGLSLKWLHGAAAFNALPVCNEH